MTDNTTAADPGPPRCEYHCTKSSTILRMSPGAEAKTGGLPTCACGGSFAA
jgi:hypothetical protein